MGPSLCGRNVFFRQIMTYSSSNIPVTTEVTGIFRVWGVWNLMQVDSEIREIPCVLLAEFYLKIIG